MNKRELTQSHSSENVDGGRRKDCYYVQSLTECIFLVRKCLSKEGEASPDDHIIRSFDVYHDAHSYASSMNSRPDKLDSTATPDLNSFSE